MKNKKFTVVVREKIQLPFRTKPDEIDREYETQAKTRRGAIGNIKRVGIKGKIIEVR